eukprot:TRINITY_DN2387_c0_g1_i3.p1 TRINITY_DN2387_c0_g1~~TRINITY_DN2387_c0_g1_i3.p1  ORF type:complete len:287 (+),score=45.83 TRINITY_DN2387_c0_g1_i3:201-1061(+)
MANLLKQWFRELPEPIFPFNYYDTVIDLSANIEDSNAITLLTPLIHSIPLPNYHLLSYLCDFLLEMSESSSMTKMDISNLSIVFGTNLVRPSPNEKDKNDSHQFKLNDIILVFSFIVKFSPQLFNRNINNENEDGSWFDELKLFTKENLYNVYIQNNKNRNKTYVNDSNHLFTASQITPIKKSNVSLPSHSSSSSSMNLSSSQKSQKKYNISSKKSLASISHSTKFNSSPNLSNSCNSSTNEVSKEEFMEFLMDSMMSNEKGSILKFKSTSPLSPNYQHKDPNNTN